MHPGAVRILDFDASVSSQQELRRRFSPTLVDLTAYGPRCRNWCNARLRQAVFSRLDPARRGDLTFIGSGDFHHITAILLEQFTQPLSLIVFDHHPDWDVMPPRYGCGSWVATALRRAPLAKALLLGIASEDIDGGPLLTADFRSLSQGKIEIYPYAHAASRVWGRFVPENVSYRCRRGPVSSVITWSSLQGLDLRQRMHALIDDLPTREVYVSVDKDCLNKRHACTNWEEGTLEFDELAAMLTVVRERCDIVGADVVGDYSDENVWGVVKGVCARLDHPRLYSARGVGRDERARINERTNLALAQLFLG